MEIAEEEAEVGKLGDPVRLDGGDHTRRVPPPATIGRQPAGRIGNGLQVLHADGRPEGRPADSARRQHLERPDQIARSEEHTSELQSRETISYAVFCLKKKK